MSRHYRDSHTRRRMASAHANHEFYCTCGKIVRGNGGRAGHAWMHERRGDGHYYTSSTRWHEIRRWRETVPAMLADYDERARVTP